MVGGVLSECWAWTSTINKRTGYASFQIGDKYYLVHRLSFAWANGDIPDGRYLDHLCRTRHCVRPDHLEPVTNLENQQRGVGCASRAKTTCPRGHDYDGVDKYGHRKCSLCRKIDRPKRHDLKMAYQRKYRLRKKKEKIIYEQRGY